MSNSDDIKAEVQLYEAVSKETFLERLSEGTIVDVLFYRGEGQREDNWTSTMGIHFELEESPDLQISLLNVSNIRSEMPEVFEEEVVGE
jgi:hypothetical protein